MKYINIKNFLYILFALLSFNVSAQNTQKINVVAVVQNTQGEPIKGAVVIGADNSSITTDESGKFTKEVNEGESLKISMLGYQNQIVRANSELEKITLSSENELISVAFGKVAEKDLLGGISYLNVTDLMDKNDLNSSGINISALIPGLNGNLWGSNGLVLVDGIPRDLGNVMPSEIDQITALKGASAVALYGSMAAKGVLLITTKRGTAGSNDFKIRVNSGIYVPKAYPKYLGSAEYMTLYNEARQNDGLSDLYSAEDIYNYSTGSNPYRYPDVDYYSSDYLRKYTNRTDAAAEFRGGNERARFYANIGFYHTNSLLNVGAGEDESVSRFHVRGNVDLKINNFISSKINSSMAFYNTSTARGDYWSNASSLRPNRYSPLIPISYLEESDYETWQTVKDSPFVIDGKYLLGGTQQQTTNPFAALYTQGMDKYTARQYQFDASLIFDLGSVLNGLSFTTQFGVDYYSRYTLSEDVNDYAVYEAKWNNHAGYDRITSLTKYNQDKVSRSRNMGTPYQYQKLFFSGLFNYNNTFNQVHNVTAVLLAMGYQQSISEQYHKPSSANIGLQTSYNYMQKYYADFTGSVIHSAKLPSGNRQALSPTFSLGWRISQENFMSGATFVDDLKITASAGTLNTDMDISDFYMYTATYVRDGTYRWSENYFGTATDIRRGENLNLGFIKRKEVSLGLDASLFNKMLRVNASYFNITRNNSLIRNTNEYPNYYVYSNTNFIPYDNYNEDRFSGFDFGISVNKKVNQVDLSLGLVGTYSVNEARKRSELLGNNNEYQTAIKKPTDGIWGLVTDGVFMSESEINDPSTPTYTYGTVKPGDFKYVDQNGDGKIDGDDRVYLGRGAAPFIYGINLTAKWRDFTFFALLDGQLGGNGVKSHDYYRVRGERKYSEVVRDRTTIGKNENGEWVVTKLGNYPRLTTSGDTNFQNSDYWIFSTDYLSLAQIQLSYDIPSKILENIFIKELGVYINGTDLLTIAKERKIMELNPGGSPYSRFFNVGFKATF